MRPIALVLLLAVVMSRPAMGEESDGVHRMLKPDGEADVDKCAVCHEQDFSLSRSKVETCTLCHAETVHGGAAEHLGASAADVAVRIPAAADASILPLTEDGRIFCGTCHFFHDPRVAEEKPQPLAWVPASTGLPEAVRRSLAAEWGRIASTHGEPEVGAKFATRSTRALRLPVADGALCRHCHGSMLQ